MDILKAAALFEKLAQQVVNLPQQVVLPDQPIVGSAVSKEQVEFAVTKVMREFAQKYDPKIEYMDSVVLQPNNAFSVDVRVSSEMVEPHQLSAKIKQRMEAVLRNTWKNSAFNITVAPMA